MEDEVARAALALVIGDDAHQPILAVGGLIGTLTIDQARRLVRIANSASSDLLGRRLALTHRRGVTTHHTETQETHTCWTT